MSKSSSNFCPSIRVLSLIPRHSLGTRLKGAQLVVVYKTMMLQAIILKQTFSNSQTETASFEFFSTEDSMLVIDPPL